MLPGSMSFGRARRHPRCESTGARSWSRRSSPSAWPSDLGAIAAIVGVVAFFASILGHEFGPRLVARRFGVGHDVDRPVGARRRRPARSANRRRRGPRAGSPPPARSPASLIGLVAYGAALVGVRLDAPDTVVTVLGWLGHRQRRCSACSTCSRRTARRRPDRARRPLGRHGNRYRAMREAGQAGRVLGWAHRRPRRWR